MSNLADLRKINGSVFHDIGIGGKERLATGVRMRGGRIIAAGFIPSFP
jgi:hypothetical protein